MKIQQVVMMVALAASTGCAYALPDAREPALGAQATGEPLWISEETIVTQHQVKEKVGEAVHKDSRGNAVGSTEVYENRTVTQEFDVWYPMQGRQQLEDEDFFRIAGDLDAADKTREMYEGGHRLNRNGKITILAGAVVMVAGVLAPIDNQALKSIAITGGGLAVGGGWYMAYAGAARTRAEHHAVPASRAIEAARAYNERTGADDPSAAGPRSIGVRVGGSF